MPRFVVDVAAFYLSCGSSDIFMFSSKHEIQNWKRKGKIYVMQEAVSHKLYCNFGNNCTQYYNLLTYKTF